MGHRRAARSDVPCRVRLVGKDRCAVHDARGSRMGRSEEDIGKLCHGATLLGGLPVRGSAVKARWMQSVNGSGNEFVKINENGCYAKSESRLLPFFSR